MPVQEHIHTYVKYKGRPGFYRCNAKDCTHFIDKERILGKMSRCNSCGAEFQLTQEDLRRAKPKCLECSNTKRARIHKKTMELAEQAADIYAATYAPIVGPEELPYDDDDDEDRF